MDRKAILESNLFHPKPKSRVRPPQTKPQLQTQQPSTETSENNKKPPSEDKSSQTSTQESKEEPAPISLVDYRLSSVGKAKLAGARRHIIRFQTHDQRQVNPVSEFTPPIKLYRKEISASTQTINDGTLSNSNSSQSLNKPAEADNATAAKTAPFATRNRFPKRRIRQVFQADPEVQKLRIEERNPWVIEDFEDNGFKIVPVERFYRFTPKKTYHTLTIDEAEERMSKKEPVPRWFMSGLDPNSGNKEGTQAKLKTTTSTASFQVKPQKRYSDDEDDLDFTEDFADDEESPYIEGNEADNRELEVRIKREMLQANAMGDELSNEMVDDFLDDKRRDVSKEGRKLRRYLKKLEKNNVYESDDEPGDPYASEIDDSESDSNEESTPGSSTNDLKKLATPVERPQPVVKPTVSVKAAQEKPTLDVEETTANSYKIAGTSSSPSIIVTLQVPTERLRKMNLQPSSSDDGKSANIKLEDTRKRLKTASSSESNSDLVNEQEILMAIQRKPISVTELLKEFAHKLQKNKRNKELIRNILLKVARMENGILIPR